LAEPKHIAAEAARVARRILNKLQIKMPSPNGVIQVGCTVGIATSPEAADAENLMILADQLLYVGKKHGRNRVITQSDLETRALQSKHSWRDLLIRS
jgi:GGDEF domain-containing protein